MTMRKVWI